MEEEKDGKAKNSKKKLFSNTFNHFYPIIIHLYAKYLIIINMNTKNHLALWS